MSTVAPAARSRWSILVVDRGGLLGLAALVLYLWLASAHITDGDNAEYSTLGSIGGVAHPTGYPLYLLWLRALAWLPAQSAAHAASLATSILGAACVVVLHAACRAWGARPLAATLAVAIYAASPLVIRISTQAEVFALNQLIAATVLWIAASAGPLRGLTRAGALGLVAGLGLSNHLTCVLLAPIGILGIVYGLREARTKRAAIGAAIAGLVVGLTPYVYLVATAENPQSWGQHLDSLHAVVHHFLREDYGGPGAFAPDPQPVSISSNLGALAAMLGRTWLWLPLVAGLAALIAPLVQRPEGGRWPWALLALSFLLAGPLLVMRFDVTHEGPGLYVIQRFCLLPALLLALPIAHAFERVLQRAGDRVVQRTALYNMLAAGAFVAIAGTSLPYVQRAHTAAVEQGVRNLLHSLPQRAVVIVYEDDLNFGSKYVQLILGERPDVAVVMSTAVGLPVVRERIQQDLGIAMRPDAKLADTAFADAVLASGRPLFVDALALDILETFPHTPYGLVFQILPRGTAPPPIHDVFVLNQALYEKFEFGYPLPRMSDDWPPHVHIRYVQMWQLIADALTAAGQRDDAATALDLGRALVPLPE